MTFYEKAWWFTLGMTTMFLIAFLIGFTEEKYHWLGP